MSLTTTLSNQAIQKANILIATAQYAGLYGVGLRSASGCYVTDLDGNTYLDFLSGASAATIGYGRSDIVDVYSKTALKIMHSCFVYSPNEEAIQLAQKIHEISPGNFSKKVMFGTSASDSIDGAIKAARKFTQRQNVISFVNSYHGSTGTSAQVTGFFNLKNGLPSSDDVFFVDFPHDDNTQKVCLSQIDKICHEHEIACCLIEPIQGDGGNVVPPFSFFSELKKLCEKYSVVFIDDETQSGAGRTGKWWAIEHFDVEPDILVAGKGITGGYIPLSFVVGKQEIIDSLEKAQHVFTYSGHPPSCAVASQLISVIESEKLLENAARMGSILLDELSEISNTYSSQVFSEVRGKGLQFGLSVSTHTGESLAALFATRCLEKGLYAGYFGPQNEVIRLHPPLTISESEIYHAVEIIKNVFQEYSQSKFPEETLDRYRRSCLGLGK